MLLGGWLLAQGGMASSAVQMITSGLTAYQSTRATYHAPLFLSYLSNAYAGLDQFDDARRCVGEVMAAVETTKETWFEAENNRMAGGIALSRPSGIPPKRKHISRALSRSPVSSKQSPGNCAPQ